MAENVKLTVPTESAGIRIDVYLAECLTELTRSRIKQLIDSGYVLVNDKEIKSSFKLKGFDIISVNIPDLIEPEIVPENIPLDIVYEDIDMLVINKPQGMVVHPAAGNYTGTLVNALMSYCGDSLSGINGEKRPGILHRIDKDTSGLLLVAKNDTAHRLLAEQIKEHSLVRAYKALVHGELKNDTGRIDLPIGRHPNDRKKMAVTYNHSRNAVTNYRVLERFRSYTFIECVLETGRTHQIRVHMSQIGHPIVCDPVYGKKKEFFSAKGQLLHAYKVGFIHPRTGKYMEFVSELPEYFEKNLKKLRNL